MSIRNSIKQVLLFISSLRNDKKSKILFYHDIYDSENYKALDADVCMGTHISLFQEHLSIIKQEGYEIVDEITKPERQIALMFDDGFRGIYDVREFFYSNNIRPTIFLAAGYIGEQSILTPQEIIELQAHGFHFECHGWSHKPLTVFNDEELKKELLESKRFLSDLVGKDITQICLPLGYYSDHLIEVIRSFGYKEIYSSVPGNYYKTVGPGLRTRNLCQFATAREVKMILRGGNEVLRGHFLRLHHKF